MKCVLWDGTNEYEVAVLVAADKRVYWREDVQAYSVNGELVYPGDTIIRTDDGFKVARA